MKYCQNCGKQISSEAKFCEFCGAQQKSVATATQKPESQQYNATRKMHCPKCKSYNIGPILDSQDTEGVSLHNTFSSSPFSGFTTLGGFSSKTTNNYEWLCMDCGKHFPNAETLFEKAGAAAGVPKVAKFFCILAVIVAVGAAFTESWIHTIIFAVAAILFFIISKLAAHRYEELLETAHYWEYMCFE